MSVNSDEIKAAPKNSRTADICIFFSYNPFHTFTEIVRSSLSCSSFGTFEKKFSPFAFSTASTVTAKVANGSSLPSLGRMKPIIFCGGVSWRVEFHEIFRNAEQRQDNRYCSINQKLAIQQICTQIWSAVFFDIVVPTRNMLAYFWPRKFHFIPDTVTDYPIFFNTGNIPDNKVLFKW